MKQLLFPSFFLFLLLLAGCVQVEQPSSTEHPLEEPWKRTTALEWNLMGGSADGSVLAIRASKNVSLEISIRAVLPLSEADLRHCAIYKVGKNAGYASMGKPGTIVVSESLVGDGSTLNQSMSTGDVHKTWRAGAEIPAGAEQRVLAAFYDAKRWAAAGATAILRLNGSSEFEWRKVGDARVTCLTGPEDFEQGRVNRVGQTGVFEELDHPFTIQGQGDGWLAVGSDWSYQMKFSGPEILIEAAGAPGDAFKSYLLEALQAGGYRLEVPHMISVERHSLG
ncbi:MAG TPA: hypothetical protein VHI93_01730, partial [Candidatus Thermoplasmatota archaeon]|nr:hypothetical protein [Candidatus Thermoplasmatota archaeon]